MAETSPARRGRYDSQRCDGICVHLRYLRFLRAMVRRVNIAMAFAMFFAILAVFAVKMRWTSEVSVPPTVALLPKSLVDNDS